MRPLATAIMLRNLFVGFVKVQILHHAAQEPIYGAAMMSELRGSLS